MRDSANSIKRLQARDSSGIIPGANSKASADSKVRISRNPLTAFRRLITSEVQLIMIKEAFDLEEIPKIGTSQKIRIVKVFNFKNENLSAKRLGDGLEHYFQFLIFKSSSNFKKTFYKVCTKAFPSSM